MGLDGETGRMLFALKPDYQLVGLDALRGFSLETQLEHPRPLVVDNFELRYDPAIQRLPGIPATLEGPEREVVADDDGVVRLDGVGLRVGELQQRRHPSGEGSEGRGRGCGA